MQGHLKRDSRRVSVLTRVPEAIAGVSEVFSDRAEGRVDRAEVDARRAEFRIWDCGLEGRGDDAGTATVAEMAEHYFGH
jgi:hypothetical protein